jgi:gingipain R
MKNLITFILYCLSVTALIAQTNSETRLDVVSSTSEETILHLQVSGFNQMTVQTPQGDALIVGIDEGAPILLEGAPDLPRFASALRIPVQGAMAVEVLESAYQDYSDIEIAPSKGNLLRNTDPATVPYLYGSQYERDQFYPGALADLQTPFILRSTRGQGVHFYPIQYNPVSKVLRVYSKLVVRVYKTDQAGVNELSTKPQNHKKSAAFSNLYDQVFVNNSVFPVERNSQVDPVKMLIIAQDDFLDEIEPLAVWKRQSGIHTTVIPVSEIGSSNADDVFNFVKDYYEQYGITYLLLVGDEDAINPQMRPSGGTDYSCDNCFGYMEGDDHLPEVFVGRFNAENEDQVKLMVARNLDYEMTPLNDVDNNWLATALGAASNEGEGIGDDDQADWQHANELKEFHLADGFERVYEFYDGNHGADSPTPGDVTADQAGNPVNTQIVDLMNTRGISLYNYTGHGWEQGLASGNFNTDAVAQLRNNHRYPIIIGVACCAGNFTNNGSGDCLGEAVQRAGDVSTLEPWGAIYGFFSSDYQSWAPPMEGQDGMNNYLLNADGIDIKPNMGAMLAFGNAGMIVDYGGGGEAMADFWNPFGEPSLVPRTRLAADLLASHVPTTFIGATTLSVSCDVEGALVSLYWEGQTLATSYVENGVADFSFPALNNVGEITVTATQFNYKPYQGIVSVTPSAGPFVVSDFITLSDPSGDNDGVADFGETVTLNIQLSNVGVDVASATQVTISTPDLNVDLLDVLEQVGDITASNSTLVNDAFTLTIHDDVVDGYVVPITVDVQYNDTLGYAFTYNMVLQAPQLNASNFVLNDQVGGNNNKRLDSGETVTLTIRNRNMGSSAAPNTVGTLTSNSPWLTISPAADLGTLDAVTGEVIEAFTIEVSDLAPQVQSATFYYTLASGNYSTEVEYGPLTINAIIEDFETHNFDAFPWAQGGSKPWVITTYQSYSGAYCTRSGSITHDETSEMNLELDITQDGTISFARRVSSEANYDFLRFYIDNVEVDSWSGNLPWEEFSYPVSAGIHSFTWSYEKDDVASSGSDRAWVDEIFLPPYQILVSAQIPNPAVTRAMVYPNPANNRATIMVDLSSEQEVQVQLLDNMGRLVQTLQAGSRLQAGQLVLPVDLTNQAPGLYFVRVQTGAQIELLKVVKI